MQLFCQNYVEIAKDAKVQDPAAYLPRNTKELVAGFARQKDVLTEAMLSKESAVLEYPFAGGPRASILLLKPLSRGTVILNTTNLSAEPVVDYRALSNPVDQRVFFDMFWYIRRFHQTPTMAQLTPVELDPGTNITTDEQLLAAMKSWVMAPSNAHAIGTAAMMPRDQGGVVGPDLLVYGTSGLSIVDASIMPLIPGTHTHGTVYAVAEKV
jgi:choline dehydrogenase-like flavoprotein